MTRTGCFRWAAIASAFLLSFSSSGAVYAHALAHLHEAREHATNGSLPPHGVTTHAAAAFEDVEHGHEHDHAAVDVGSSTRELTRFAVAVVNVPSMIGLPACISSDDRQQPAGLALLPRPGPGVGPPSGPRAPPVG